MSLELENVFMSKLLSQLNFLLVQLGVYTLLTGCSPTIVSSPATVSPAPELLEDTFISHNGTSLSLRKWLPSQQPTAVIIAVHGFNDYSNFIHTASPFFNSRQITVYAYDQRGFGQTLSRGRWSGYQAMAEDLTTFVTLIRKKHPMIPVYVLGDSMGGAVTIISLTRKKQPIVDGAILVAPAVWSRSEMPFYQRVSLWLAAHTIPWKKVTGGFLKITPSDNIEMLRELGKDPLVIKETRIEAIYGLANLMDEAFQSAEQLKIDCLLLYGARDEVVPRAPVLNFYDRLPYKMTDKQQFILYKNGYHMLLRDLEGEKVMQDIFRWIDAR